MYYEGRAIVCVDSIDESGVNVSVQLIDANGQPLAETWTGTLPPGTCVCLDPVGIEGQVSTVVDYCTAGESRKVSARTTPAKAPAPSTPSNPPTHKK